MPTLLERLRAALAADYDVSDELASGGMGVVYRARDRHLDRLVAIKIIRPELATAAGAERFLREARLLAAFSHPNIVQIHRAGEADGIGYYVMDYLDGHTLEERLKRGPLPADEVRRVGDDLLAALEAVHIRGIVHRDVKPSNVFLAGGRAILSDFGISKASNPAVTALTQPGGVIGTPGYMPPEQLSGDHVAATADVCAAAMVLYETWTGRRWIFDSQAERADWSDVPADVAPALRRALSWSPGERFPDAGAFRRALAAGTRRRRRRMAGAAAAAIAALGVWIWFVLPTPLPVAAGGAALQVRIQPLVEEGGATAGLGDNLSIRLAHALRGAPDINFSLGPADRAALEVEGSVSGRADSLTVRLHVSGLGEERARFTLARAGAGAAVVDSLSHDLLLRILQLRDRALGDALPVEALPGTTGGLIEMARAEALYAGAQWEAARQGYESALAADSSCAVCALRLITMAQWARLSPDPTHARHVLSAFDRFPARYQQLIRTFTDTADRWALRDSLVTQFPRFDLGHFAYADELYHRGPLAGRSRRLAQEHLRSVLGLRPGFAPAWEHLAWIAIGEGDAATADTALARYFALTDSTDRQSVVIRALLSVGARWRFAPRAEAEQVTAYVLSQPAIANVPDLRSGPRYLLGFDAPEGVLWLGRRFAAWPGRPELKPHGLAGQIAALLALGRAQQALNVAGQLRGESPDPEYALVAAEFDAALTLFDSLNARAAWPRLREALAPLARDDAGDALQRRRAAWMLTLLARRAGHAAEARDWNARVTGETAPQPFAALLEADAIAATDPARAERLTRPLLALDSAGRAGDPFYRAALHLLRAQWILAGAQPDTAAAERELLWYENTDVIGQSPAIVQSDDVDWGFGTLARWYRGRLTQTPGGSEVCRALAGVARLWQNGEPRYRERAASARLSAGRLECPPAR